MRAWTLFLFSISQNWAWNNQAVVFETLRLGHISCLSLSIWPSSWDHSSGKLSVPTLHSFGRGRGGWDLASELMHWLDWLYFLQHLSKHLHHLRKTTKCRGWSLVYVRRNQLGPFGVEWHTDQRPVFGWKPQRIAAIFRKVWSCGSSDGLKYQRR